MVPEEDPSLHRSETKMIIDNRKYSHWIWLVVGYLVLSNANYT